MLWTLQLIGVRGYPPLTFIHLLLVHISPGHFFPHKKIGLTVDGDSRLMFQLMHNDSMLVRACVRACVCVCVCVRVCVCVCEIETDRQTNRQTDRETERGTDRERTERDRD